MNINRCTDGIWLGISLYESDQKKICYVIIDCEGLFNIRRTLDEEIKLVLSAISVSDITIFNTNNNIDNRYFKDFFDRLQQIYKRLDG